MGKTTGFLDYPRATPEKRPVEDRVQDFDVVYEDTPLETLKQQAARCMDCGVPFCNRGCPLGNVIPDWNDLTYRDRPQEALARLHATNNFPEVTGLVCPAPCEASCVLAIHDAPVTIRAIEWSIIKRGFDEGWITPQPPVHRTGRSVAVIGSGPAGLAAAQQLARAGHFVTVFEKSDRIGGLLRYGIPDFKLDKSLLDLRLQQLEAEGVTFRTSITVGRDVDAARLRAEHDAVLLACGAEVPRDLDIPGRDLEGVHFALPYLTAQNRHTNDPETPIPEALMAKDRHVVVIGGGDTGSDCVGTALRQGARSVTNVELMERPPPDHNPDTPWPLWPNVFRTSSSHEEGGQRAFAIKTTRFEGTSGTLERLHTVQVQFATGPGGRRTMSEVEGTHATLPCDMVLLALGYTHPAHDTILAQLDVERTQRGNVKADTTRFATNLEGVFAAGDVRRGQSLVVWAIWEGRQAAAAIDGYLRG